MNTPDSIIAAILAHEGGWSDNPNDSGGPTNHGITLATLAEYRGHAVTVDDLRALTTEQAADIYRQRYYEAPHFDRVAKLSHAIAAELTDTGVNMGPFKATTYLQRTLRVLNRGGKDYADIQVDGALGQKTLAALKAFLFARRPMGESVVLKALNCLQGAAYIELAERREKDEAFIYGWLKNRVVIGR